MSRKQPNPPPPAGTKPPPPPPPPRPANQTSPAVRVMDEPLRYTLRRHQEQGLIPCLYHVAPPCAHPKCIDAYYETLKAAYLESRQ